MAQADGSTNRSTTNPSYSPHDEVEILGYGWTKVPAFWLRELMPLAEGIPANFWKFLLIVWHDVLSPGSGFKCRKSMTQFHMDKDTASKWTAALWASCMFDVTYGKKHVSNVPGTPTVIAYRTETEQQDWVCFINALREALRNDKENNFCDVEGFRIELTFRLRDALQENHIPTVEVDARINGWVTDGTITVKDGMCTYPRKCTDRSRVLDAKGSAYYHSH